MKRGLAILKDESGAAAAEYALAIAIVGAALTFGALALGTAISDSVDKGGESECVAASTLPPPEC